MKEQYEKESKLFKNEVSIEDIEEIVNLNKVPVWLPYKMINTDQELSSNWDVTSDSLVLWLAGKLKAEHTLLIKSLSASNRNAFPF